MVGGREVCPAGVAQQQPSDVLGLQVESGKSEVDVVHVRAGEDQHQAPGPSPRILDTLLVDYAAVGSVAARWAS